MALNDAPAISVWVSPVRIQRLRFRQAPQSNRAEEEVQQPLARRGIVESLADQW